MYANLLREFSYESLSERILKIVPHLPKLLSNIKGYTFLRHSVLAYIVCKPAYCEPACKPGNREIVAGRESSIEIR